VTRTKSTTKRLLNSRVATPSVDPTYVWRRLHGGRLIAEVCRVEGMGSWLAAAYSARNDSDLVRIPQSFSVLTEAQRAADNLVRESFKHSCRTGECGRWLRWPD
jgi:hypothetical protein